jgi:hypothetical protein
LKAIQNRISQQSDIRIAGEIGRCSPQKVARFLFRIGFLTARQDHEDGTYEHFAYAEKPFLLENSNNLDHGHGWEIHPVFRQVLGLRNAAGQQSKGVRRGGGREGR